MGSERTELDALRTYMTALLREQGVEAMEAWPMEERPRLTGAVAAVSIRSCRAEPGAFWEYLGEELDPDTGTWRERYGRRLEVVFGLDLYAPQTALDREGRRVLIGWMRMPGPVASAVAPA